MPAREKVRRDGHHGRTSENESRFTVEQAAAANTVLRAALGLPPQRFALAQFVGMISDEIEQLRLAGKTDADIAALLEREIGVTVAADDIRRLYASPAQRRSS